MRIDLTTRWFDVSFVGKRDRPQQTNDPGMFVSNTASSEQLTYHETDAPTLGYRSQLPPTNAQIRAACVLVERHGPDGVRPGVRIIAERYGPA